MSKSIRSCRGRSITEITAKLTEFELVSDAAATSQDVLGLLEATVTSASGSRDSGSAGGNDNC